MIGVDTTFLVEFEDRDSPKHAHARGLYARRVVEDGERLVLIPPVLMEFVHVITDRKRFRHPLPMAEALDRAEQWWNAPETDRLVVNSRDVALSFRWMREHRLGRKRVLDTPARGHPAQRSRAVAADLESCGFPGF